MRPLDRVGLVESGCVLDLGSYRTAPRDSRSS